MVLLLVRLWPFIRVPVTVFASTASENDCNHTAKTELYALPKAGKSDSSMDAWISADFNRAAAESSRSSQTA